VARLMRDLGLAGVRRGKRVRTTIPEPAGARARRFERWVCEPCFEDFATEFGWVLSAA
jgi:hypothetical protein